MQIDTMSVVAALRLQPSALLEEGERRLVHRDRAGDRGQEEHEEPGRADEVAEAAHVGEDHRQGGEAEAEGAGLHRRRSVPERPRKTNEAVSVIMPPKPTSKSSLVAEAVRPESTTSSFFFM